MIMLADISKPAELRSKYLMFKLFANKKLYESPITGVQLQKIIDSVIAKDITGHNLKKVMPYSWRNNDAMFKSAINYTFLKGQSGTLTWGVNIDFIPVVREKIEWFRAPKKFLLHLSDHPAEYKTSFIGEESSKGISSHWGEKDARKSINSLWENNRNKIFNWLKDASTLEGLIELTQDQIFNKKLYATHHPKPKYVLPFLYAKSGEGQTAIELFDDLELYHFNQDEELKNKVRSILLNL